MSTICDDLRAAILQAAIQGKLTEQVAEDGDASDLLQKIDTINLKKNNKKQKAIKPITNGEIPFDIPSNWVWVRLDRISKLLGGNAFKGNELLKEQNSDYVRVIRISDFNQNGIIEKAPVFTRDSEKYNSYVINKNDILMCMTGGTVGKCCIVKELNEKYLLNQRVADIRVGNNLEKKYIYSCLISPLIQQLINESKNSTNDNISSELIRNFLIPIPPLAEQKRIVKKVDELMARVADLEQSTDALASLKKAFPDDIKASLLQAAMQGKLTKQLSEDGNAEDLLEEITISESIGARKVKKKTIESDLYEESLFEIPSSWKWVKLGSVCAIARGGSPRPIKDFLTESVDGINWIKIGDTDKGGKYIWSTKERIKKEGLAKSRMIHAGDFLLTNSMSFGRPYISKIDGCIHDGWLVISQSKPIFDENYLFYVLSSRFMYYQFCGKVSGAVVKNLNSDKVANSVVPLPPLAEQKRIVERLEKLMQNINAVGDLIASE